MTEIILLDSIFVPKNKRYYISKSHLWAVVCRGWLLQPFVLGQTFSVKHQKANVLGCRLQSLSGNHQQHVNEWVWLCSSTTLPTKTDSRPDLTGLRASGLVYMKLDVTLKSRERSPRRLHGR